MASGKRVQYKKVIRHEKYHFFENDYSLLQMTQYSQNKAWFEAIINSITDSVVIVDSQRRIIMVNPAFEKLTGYSREEVIGKNPRILNSGKQDAGLYNEMWDKLVHGEVWRGHFVNKKKDGTLFEEDATISPVKNADGKIISYVAVKRDITKKVLLEAQLRQALKMETIATLAGGIVHEFNNILGIIFGNADMALDDIPAGNPARENINDLLEASVRARNIVKQLVDFTRQSEQEFIPLIPGAFVKESLKFLRSITPSTVRIVQNICTDCGTILADPSKLKQLFVKLFFNAVQAMDEKGTLEVIGKIVELEAIDIAHQPDMRPGPYFKLSVSDTGVGMDKETQERIFDPFCTTKEDGDGVGMGFYIVMDIVQNHSGMITVDSEPGEGSTFHVFFPQVAQEEVQKKGEIECLPHGNERILLVDDEEMLLKMGSKMLERQGYQITVKTSGMKALKTFKSNPDKFDLVITDQSMPGMAGSELAVELLKIRQDIPVILCTDYSAKISKEKAQELGIKEFYYKPLDRVKLVKTIRKVLDEN